MLVFESCCRLFSNKGFHESHRRCLFLLFRAEKNTSLCLHSSRRERKIGAILGVINAERRCKNQSPPPIPEMVNFAGVVFHKGSWKCSVHGPNGKLPGKPAAAGVE